MSDAFRYAIPHDRIHTGTIVAATLTPSDIVFHPGPNETRFTAKGMIYRGELVEDAGAAHAILMRIMTGRQQLAPPTSAPPSSAKVHPSVWADPVLNLMREARDSMVDFGPRGTQFEIIADIDKILEQGVLERTPNQLPPTRSGTHTFAALEVSATAFDEIATLLRAARYDHAFVGDIIDMTNIGLDRRAT